MTRRSFGILDRAFREAKTATFRQSLARLQQASGPAVKTLLKILVDPNAQQEVKARCASYIPDQTRKAMETEEIEVRVVALEAAATSRQQRR